MSECICSTGSKSGDYDHSDYCPIGKDQRIAELRSDKLVLMERDKKYCNTISGLQAENLELQAELADLRRGVDNIKIRSYELGQHELHDKALALLGVGNEKGI